MFWRSYAVPSKAIDETGSPPLAIALQGGGAYGAFTWGVLDRLLQERDVLPSAFSGASAGAVNAVVTAWGLMRGGRDGARQALRQFWEGVGQKSLLSPMGLPGADLQFELWTRLFSPYQFNPLNFNPLRDLLGGMVDFEELRSNSKISLFIAATDVASGEPRIFREQELTLEVLMASTCLPHLSQAVEIGGRSYWDGGLSANPPILPMVLETHCRTLLVVKLTPDEEPVLPTAAPDILSRLRRILLNGSLQRDLVALSEMRNLLNRSNLSSGDLRRIRDLTIRQVTIAHSFFGGNGGGSSRPDSLEKLFEAGSAAIEGLVRPKTVVASF